MESANPHTDFRATSTKSIHRIGGLCALLGAACVIGGAIVGATHGLGGQNLPLTTREGILDLSENRTAYTVRESLFPWYAVFAVGEGVGLFFLLRQSRSISIWAFVFWNVGLILGIAQDATVVAVVDRFATDYATAAPASQESLLVVRRTIDAVIRYQQAICNVLGIGLGVSLFSWAMWTTGVAARWLSIVGFGAAALAGFMFPVANICTSGSHDLVFLGENGFTLMLIWDISCGIVLLRAHRT